MNMKIYEVSPRPLPSVMLVVHNFESVPNNVSGWIGVRYWDKLYVSRGRNFWWRKLALLTV